MEFHEAVQTRCSVRKYDPRPVPRDVLDRIIEAVRRAPSWANVQATRFVIVTDETIKAALAATLTPGNPSREAVRTAPVVVGICFIRERSGFYKEKAITTLGEWGLFDAGLAAANLTLAAAAEGLGTVHVAAIDLDKAADVLKLPFHVQMVELIPLGYPATPRSKTTRLESQKVFFREEYRGTE